MLQSAKITGYLKTLCEQIRWKKAHGVISQEVENHIIDQTNAFIADGLDEEAATDKAIIEMGDPILVGSEFDRTYRPKIEWSIFTLTNIILCIGLVVRMFITIDASTTSILTKSIINTILGIGCMIIAYCMDFATLGKYPKIIFLGLIAIFIGVIAVSPMINGQRFYAKFILLLFPTAFAGIIYSMRNKGYRGIILCGVFFVIPWIIGLAIQSVSSVFLYSLACLVLLTFAIAKGWFNVRRLRAILLVYCPTLAITIFILLMITINEPYRWERLQIAINPSLNTLGIGYVGSVTRDMISNARFIGQGALGKSSGLILPNIDTDHLLTYLIHRLGWISFIVIMAAVSAFIIRSFILCTRQKSILGRLVSTSVLITFTLEIVLYVISNLGFQLFSPLTLPLISYGGAATMTNMVLIGIMLSVFKVDSLVRDNPSIPKQRKNKFFEITDGKIIINFKID